MSEPVIAQKGPFPVELQQGKTYYWCRCGRSKNQPFCDGSHKDTDFTPVEFTADKSGHFFLCGCKHSKKPPMCDGSHSKLT